MVLDAASCSPISSVYELHRPFFGTMRSPGQFIFEARSAPRAEAGCERPDEGCLADAALAYLLVKEW